MSITFNWYNVQSKLLIGFKVPNGLTTPDPHPLKELETLKHRRRGFYWSLQNVLFKCCVIFYRLAIIAFPVLFAGSVFFKRFTKL